MTQPTTTNRAQPEKPSTLIVVFLTLFSLFTVGVAFTGASKALVVLYPAGAFFLAILSYRIWKPGYIGLVCWLWFFSPCIRRIVEFRAGGSAMPILLSAFFATCVPGLFLIGSWSQLITRRSVPIFYILGGIFYGAVIATTHFRFHALGTSLLAWLSPVFFTFFLFQERDRYQEFYRSFETAFLGATIVSGAYGIYQFLVFAPWDAYWMLNSNVISFGQPEAWQVRVFGTMNSPQVFAAFMVGGILISFRSHNKMRFLAAPLGLAALILTMSRSGWVSLVVGTIYLCFYLTNRQRLQLAGVVLACGILVGVGLQNSELNDVVTKRFQSLSSGKSDDSLASRISDYSVLAQLMVEQPFGIGLGDEYPNDSTQSTSTSAASGISSRDSTITSTLISMGWIGTAAFLLGVFLICVNIFAAPKPPDDSLITARAIVLAIFAEAPLNNVSSGPIAFIIWACIGACLAQSEFFTEATRSATARLRSTFARSPVTAT